MNELVDQLEAERYELFEGPAYHFSFNRRQFLKAFSGGIALIVPMSNLVAHTLQQEQGESGRNRSNERVPDDIGAWIHIDESGTVSAFTGKVEIGQNIRTSFGPGCCRRVARTDERGAVGNGRYGFDAV